jgi:hypothetical protein
MALGIHINELPEESLRPTMPDHSRPYERPPLKRPYAVSVVATGRAGAFCRLITPLDTPRRTPLEERTEE